MKTLKKILSLGIAVTMVCSDLYGSIPVTGITVLGTRERPGFLQVEIPGDLASIEEVYEASPRDDAKLILHVQNAHGNYEAQLKIKKLLEYLYQKYSFKLVFVEGATEKLNPEYLRLFPDAEKNAQLADALARKGELTGSELFLIDGPEDMEAVGIEDAELYRADYEAFKEVAGRRDVIDHALNFLEQRLQTLSSRIHSSETRRLLSEWKKFSKGHREFLPYVQRLAQDAKKYMDLDLESLFAQVEWPQVTRLLVLQSMEADLDKTAAVKEQKTLVDFLRQQKVSESLVQAVEELGKQQVVMARLAEAQTQEHLPRYLLERLVEEAGPKGFFFHDYPAFSLYAGYLILESELESRRLFEEIELLFEKLLSAVTVTEIEKDLLELFQDHNLLQKLLHLELTRKDWARASYRKQWIRPPSLLERIQKLADQTRGMPLGKGDDFIQVELGNLFEAAYRFYEYARRRETAFYQTMQGEMKARGAEKAVLITGGFHTEGILEMFRDQEISYGVLMPRIQGEVKNNEYLTTMLQTRKTIFDLAQIEMGLNALPRSEMRTMGITPNPRTKLFLNDFIQVVSNSKNQAELRRNLEYLQGSLFGRDREVRSEIREDQNDVNLRLVVGGIPYQATFSKRDDGFTYRVEGEEIKNTVQRSNMRIDQGSLTNELLKKAGEPVDSLRNPLLSNIITQRTDPPMSRLVSQDKRSDTNPSEARQAQLNTLEDLRGEVKKGITTITFENFSNQFTPAVLVGRVLKPSDTIVSLTRGILGRSGLKELAAFIGRNESQLVSPTVAAHPVFASQNVPSFIKHILVGMPTKSILETSAAILQKASPRLGILHAFVLPKDQFKSLNPEQLEEIQSLIEEIQSRPGSDGQPLGRRFYVMITSESNAQRNIRKASKAVANAVYQAAKADSVTEVERNSLALLDSSLDSRIYNPDTNLQRQSFTTDPLLAGRDDVALLQVWAQALIAKDFDLGELTREIGASVAHDGHVSRAELRRSELRTILVAIQASRLAASAA